MGGDSLFPPLPSTEEESSLCPNETINFSVSSGDDEGLSYNMENSSFVKGESGLNFVEFPNLDPRFSSINEATERQRLKVYAEVLRSYEELHCRLDRLDEAKNKILSYNPGSWAEKASGMDLSEYDVPNKTSLLLTGPKGSGKSSLVNKISRVLEDNIFLSERAQVSCRCYFFRKSDSKDLKAQLKCKARRGCSSSQFTAINFVIFVVNGLSVLASMDSVEEMVKQYCQMIAANFKCPLLSFKDDKPVIVVTHGDLLSLSDRVRVRVYLGELLGVSPTRQIFDIPENNDSATRLAIVDMLIYCLEHADGNLPAKGLFVGKVYFVECLVFWMVLAIAILFGILGFRTRQPLAPSLASPMKIEWHKIRHMWLG